ncbi:MFS transporter [Streptomyces sp. NPDC015125]|uniref:MFS transporter n=1 Tax=Streptomyces sp. NPDC015125 TaxID=3364938 RepID=UPI0036FE6FEE
MTTRTVPAPPSTVAPNISVTYRSVLQLQYVGRLLAGAIVGHLPVAMAPLAILLVVRAEGGSVRLASLLAAIYGVSAAVGQPLWGRLLDRRGHFLTLTLTALASTGAFAALALQDLAGQPVAAGLWTAAAGLATPPLEAALRVLWPVVAPCPAQQRAALAMDACAQEVVFIAGPLLVLGLYSTAGAGVVLVATALLGLIGTSLFAGTRPARRQRSLTPARADWLGPLRCPGPRVLAAALLGAGCALGALNVVALSLAERHHAPALTTLVPAALAVGSLGGGLVYGQRVWCASLFEQLLHAAVGLFVGLLVYLVVDGPVSAVAAALLPGVFLAPLLVVCFASLERLAPEGTLGEASAWLIASLGLGQAAGTALAGMVGAHAPLGPALIAVSGAALACVTLAGPRAALAEL